MIRVGLISAASYAPTFNGDDVPRKAAMTHGPIFSSCFNGYDPAQLDAHAGEGKFPFSPVEQQFEGVRAVKIWDPLREAAEHLAAIVGIPEVCDTPEQCTEDVDAVIIPDDGSGSQYKYAVAALEKGLPTFVDKPLAINVPDLNQFIRWHNEGRVFLSSSNMRYAPETKLILRQKTQLGQLRWIASCTSKTWERYAIHALEVLWPVLGPGFVSVRTASQPGSDLAYVTHRSGVQISLAVIFDAVGSYGALHVFGTQGNLAVTCWDTYTAFRNQLCAFLEMLRTGQRPYPLSETVELMTVIIAGLRSRERGGSTVQVEEIRAELEPLTEGA